ncbi:MAG: hypothetical protein RJA92_921 [Bacteroidota bacterium]|jgi:uncharacterized protein (TIGR02757 family)
MAGDKSNIPSLKAFFDSKVAVYNQVSFIKDDPICIPHLFSSKQDIEIAGFFASIFAWGNRTTIIQKSKELMQLMDNAPHAFCTGHKESDLKKLLAFKHRTFNTTDLLYFISFFQEHYKKYDSLEDAFVLSPDKDPAARLHQFHNYFFSFPDAPPRTKKHIATPIKGSTCKRLNMYLRWMVRKDNKGVDFGIWNRIKPSELICPIDLHVARVAKRFQLLDRTKIDWQAGLELTQYLKTLDPKDPVKYDFALFGLGVIEKYV